MEMRGTAAETVTASSFLLFCTSYRCSRARIPKFCCFAASELAARTVCSHLHAAHEV